MSRVYSEVIESDEVEQFPRILKSAKDKVLILFIGDRVGTVVALLPSCQYTIGFHRSNWPMEDMESFNGEVRLYTE